MTIEWDDNSYAIHVTSKILYGFDLDNESHGTFINEVCACGSYQRQLTVGEVFNSKIEYIAPDTIARFFQENCLHNIAAGHFRENSWDLKAR